ncbi:MAG: hypothetical protein HY318_20245 [Armatimonadetes bacterium]|nr:hypothetical protein [Armatimonadota bacterium]
MDYKRFLATIEWTGQMLMSGQAWPFRIVVHLTTGESATSAEGYITQP